GSANVLGFTNDRLLADLDHRIDLARRRLEEAAAWVSRAEEELNSFEARRAAYRTVTELSWDQVDVASLQAEREHWNLLVEEVRAGNPKIDQLQEQVEELRRRAKELTERLGGQEETAQELREAAAAAGD